MIAYYAHSHGSGHCNYAEIISKIFAEHIFVLTDSDFHFSQHVDVIQLQNENIDGTEFDRNHFIEPIALHYAPINIRKITERNKSILEHVLARKAQLLIIDVSVEIAMLARVSSIPYAYVRLMGDRNDLAHLNAFMGATFLLAYFPEELEPESTPNWVREKTIYLGFLSKFHFDKTQGCPPEIFRNASKPILLRVNGFGGNSSLTLSDLTKDLNVFSIGPLNAADDKTFYTDIGIVSNVRPYLKYADIILAACGSNTTSEILSLGKTFIAIAEERHFNEQITMAKRLHKMGWATCLAYYKSPREAINAFLKRRISFSLETNNSELLTFKANLERVNYRPDKFWKYCRSKKDEINLDAIN